MTQVAGVGAVKAAAVKEDPAADANEEEEEKEGAGAEGSNGLPVKLSTNRRADISEFKGKTYVSIREYYEVRRRSRTPCVSPLIL